MLISRLKTSQDLINVWSCFYIISHLCLPTAAFNLICKTSYSGLDGLPVVSYPGCEEKNCSAAPSLPPVQMHLGKGWTARHRLTQETRGLARGKWAGEYACGCLCATVCLPIVSVVWLAATRSTGREESERCEEVEGEDRAVPFTLESVWSNVWERRHVSQILKE